MYNVCTCCKHVYTLMYTVHTSTYNVYTWWKLRYTCINYVHTLYIGKHNMYVHSIYKYVIHIYLYSTACLYNKSSDCVNLFCCSSFILGRNPPSDAAACDILLPVVATGTGSLLSNVWSLSKQDRSWHSKPLINLLMASSVSVASGLASKKSPSSGQGLPPSISSREAEGRGMSLCPASASLCRPWKPVETTGYTMYIHGTYIVHTWFIHWHTMYMCTVYSMLVPQRQFPLWSRL